MKTFTLTEDHITLLINSYVTWNTGSNIYGAACIDSKRPYGGSDILGDIYELVEGKDIYEAEFSKQGIDYDELSKELYNKYKTLHKDTETALQIVLHTGTFEPGEYCLEGYGKEWIKIN